MTQPKGQVAPKVAAQVSPSLERPKVQKNYIVHASFQYFMKSKNTTLVICRSVSKLAYTFEIDLPHKLLQNKIKVVQNPILHMPGLSYVFHKSLHT